MINLHLCLYSIIVFALPFQVKPHTTSFGFNRFNQRMHEIQFEGDAYADDPLIRLTRLHLNDSVGRATYFNPIHLWNKASGTLADFKTHFSFAINYRDNATRGYGFAFFLANNGSQLGPLSGGSRLGLSNENTSLKYPFVAVEFDTVYRHIGIDANSLYSANLTKWSCNDALVEGPIQAWIEYKSYLKKLIVHVANDCDRKIVSYNLEFDIDFRTLLSEWVAIGFSASTCFDLFEEHEVHNWDFSSSLQLVHRTANQTGTKEVVKPNPGSSGPKVNIKGWVWALLGASGTLVLLLAVACFVYCRIRQMSEESRQDEFENEAWPRRFSYEELVAATNNFHDDRIIGKGGSGMVYIGFLQNGLSIAVKRITPGSEQGLKAFVSEVKTISQIHHRNLVRPDGWCRRNQQLLIVYEFMPNKSLDFHLFNETGLLTWERRYAIALGIASGLQYLHEECQQCVLHRDIKSSNVLLDSDFTAKLGDFGLSRLVEHGKDSNTTTLIGTIGYMSPEYLMTCRATKQSDAYSFGIVALEIATGKPAFRGTNENGTASNVHLVNWVHQHYQNRNISDVVDPQLGQNYVEEEMVRLIVVGLACAHPSVTHRLSIREAIHVLTFTAPLPVLSLEGSVQPTIASSEAIMNAFCEASPVKKNENLKLPKKWLQNKLRIGKKLALPFKSRAKTNQIVPS